MAEFNKQLDQLARGAAGLEATSSAATEALWLTRGTFASFSIKVFQPMALQRVLPRYRMFSSDRATFYGGGAATNTGNFTYGHIQAEVREPVPERAARQADFLLRPVRYIPRSLDANHGLVTVETPTLTLTPGEPVVTEYLGDFHTYRKTTIYNQDTGAVTIKHGDLVLPVIDDTPVRDDTVELNAFRLPDGLLIPRLATLVRTINAVSAMFARVAVQDMRYTSVSIVR